MLTKHKDSHVDHGLTQAQIDWLLERFQDKDGFFIETVELPLSLNMVPCGLYGPIMGDEPVPESAVHYAPRGHRPYPSRLVQRPKRYTSKVTVIAGPHDRQSCVLFTAFGGPLAPREPGDPELLEKDRQASVDFWNQHALAVD